MTKLSVSPEIFRTFPAATFGVVCFKNIENHGEKPEVLEALRNTELQIISRFTGTAVNDHPQIAPWREAYRKFGAKPKDYPSSIENLVKRVLKGHRIPHINLLVDIYNTISLQYIVPVGGGDLDKIEGDVELTYAGESEPPVLLLGEQKPRAPRPGEVIYRDRISAICRRWNWKEADRTKFTEKTTNGFLITEGLPPVDGALLQQVIDDLAVLVQTYCGGAITTAVIDSSTGETQL